MFSFKKFLKKLRNYENYEEQNITKEELEKRYDEPLKNDFDDNIKRIKDIFHFPYNEDLIVRDIQISAFQKKATLVYLAGMVDDIMISNYIIHSLTEDTTTSKDLKGLMLDVVNIKNSKIIKKMKEVVDDIVNGNTVLIIEGYREAISFSTTKFEHRNVDKPVRENTLRGAQESFVGSAEVNRSLVRKRLRSENLVTENIIVGERSKGIISIMYVADLVDLDALIECKKRIKEINADTVQDIEFLEQFIEDKPYSLIPSLLYTERPDRAISFLMEGHIVLLMDSSSACLVLPITFWSLFHTADDMNSRWVGGIFIRIIRATAIFAALLTSALYLAITKFHTEMLPTDLLLSITGTREMVPFPAIVEVMFMLIAFELIHEAGIRIPSAIGPTIGIVGALIIGQAAVQANIVSPILVIIVGLTGLSSFAIPENSINIGIRIYRIVLIFLASILGMYGVAIGVMFMISYLVSYTSFGVPFLSPLSPHRKSSGDLLFRRTVVKQFLRPFNMNPQDTIRQQKLERSENDEQKK